MAGGKNEASLLIRIKQAGGEILDHFVVTLGDVAEAVKKVGEFLYSFIEAYGESERAVRELSQAMVNQGMYTTDLRKEYEHTAEELQKLTQYSHEQIVAADAILQSYIGQRKVSEELTKATLDLAAAKKIDLASAADIMGRAISKNTDTLKRYGLIVEDSNDKSIRMKNVIEGVEKKFKDQAIVAAQGVGSVSQLKNSYQDLKEEVGERLAPAFVLIVKTMTGVADAVKSSHGAFDGILTVIKLLAQFAVLNFGVIEAVVKTVFGDIGALVSTTSKVLSRDFSGAWQEVKDWFNSGGSSITSSYENTKNRLQAINDAFLKDKEAKLKEEERLESESKERRKQKDLDFDVDRATKMLEQEQHKQDQIILFQEMEDQAGAQRIASQVKVLDKMIADSDSYAQKKQLMQTRALLIEQQRDAIAKEQARQREALFQTQRADIISASADLIAAVGDRESKAVFFIQKAAALATTWMLTQVAAAQAMASIPYPANIAAAANVETIGYIKMATIAATAIKGLATGGIVSATNGGTPFILGEGGKDEAVIPLDDPDAKSRLGGGTTIIFQGPTLGDEHQAEMFARVIDRALLKLRQSGQSVSFETDVF